MSLFSQFSPETQAMLGSSLGSNPFQSAPESIAPKMQPMPQGMFGAPSVTPAKPSFFGEGGPGKGIAGAIGDFLLQRAGAQPIYEPIRQQEIKHQQALDDYARQSQAALQREMAIYNYKLAHPEPTDVQQALRAAGIDEHSPQGLAILAQAAQTKAQGPLAAVDVTHPDGSVTREFMAKAPIPQGPPQAAKDALLRNPALAKDYDAKYGSGEAAKVLGGATAAPSRTFP